VEVICKGGGLVPRALFNRRYLTRKVGARRGGCLPLNNARGIGPLPA
jgi:hypothetical protein